jgi:large subunit ribosomal protein L15
MKLHELIKIKLKQKKRIGRGESSGKGKTAGCGAKGQKKREKIKTGFEGGQLPIYKRLPQKRGVGNAPKAESITITTDQLNTFPTGSTIDEKSLREAGVVSKNKRGIKIKVVAGGKLEKKLKVDFPTSKAARSQIEKAGGKVGL